MLSVVQSECETDLVSLHCVMQTNTHSVLKYTPKFSLVGNWLDKFLIVLLLVCGHVYSNILSQLNLPVLSSLPVSIILISLLNIVKPHVQPVSYVFITVTQALYGISGEELTVHVSGQRC